MDFRSRLYGMFYKPTLGHLTYIMIILIALLLLLLDDCDHDNGVISAFSDLIRRVHKSLLQIAHQELELLPVHSANHPGHCDPSANSRLSTELNKPVAIRL